MFNHHNPPQKSEIVSGPGALSRLQAPGGTRSFTLVELLVVLAIIAILTAVAAPLIPSLLRGNQVDAGVTTLSGIMEEAREAATSGNTYVWVAFTDAPTGSPLGTYVAVIQSADGTESPINTTVTPIWAQTVTVPSGNLILHSKLQNIPGLKFVDPTATGFPATLTAQAPANAQNLFETGMQWTVTTLKNTSADANGGTVFFTHAIEFTPDGEAHVPWPPWNSNMQFGLMPTLGSTTNSILFNVSRLTGKTTVYRQ